MISLAKKTGYGLIALTHLAGTNEACVSARAIAAEYGVPVSLLMNVLKVLSAAGFVRSWRGPRGGYSLARPADQITLAEVIETIEGPIHFVACAAGDSDVRQQDLCGLVARCPIHDPVCRIHEKMRRFLRDITIEDLAGGREPAARAEPCELGVGFHVGEDPDLS